MSAPVDCPPTARVSAPVDCKIAQKRVEYLRRFQINWSVEVMEVAMQVGRQSFFVTCEHSSGHASPHTLFS